MGLLVLVVIIIQLPPVQRLLTSKAETYLQNKLKTKVKVGEISLSFPKSIYLGDIYIEALNHDTLLYSHSIKVDLEMFGLLNHRLTVNSLKIEKLTAHINRIEHDTDFNFSFIVKAFSSSSNSTPQKPDSSKKAFVIDIRNIYLSDFYGSYNDALTGMDASARVGILALEMQKMDLDHMAFSVKKLDFKNSIANLTIYKQSQADTNTSKPSNFSINIDDIELANIKGLYKDKVGGQSYSMNLGKSTLKNSSLLLATQKIEIGSVELYKSLASVSLNENKNVSLSANPGLNTKTSQQQPNIQQTGWTVSLKKFDMSQTGFDFDNRAIKHTASGMDYNHLSLTDINTLASNISYRPTCSAADIKQLGFTEKCGFKVRTLRTKILFDSNQTELTDFDINTGNSHISRYLSMKYKSLDDFTNHIGSGIVKADVSESIIGYRDVLYFVPDLAKTAPFSRDPDGTARLAAKINGPIGNLNLENVLMTGASGTVLHVNGNIKNLPDIDKTIFNIDIKQMCTVKSDITYFTPPNTIPKSINLPQKINAKGYFRGYINNFSTFLDIGSSQGSAVAKLNMKLPKNSKNTSYTASISTTSLQLGELLNQQKTLGPLTMVVDITGSGLALPDINTQIKAHINQATAMQYPYKDINIEGNFKNEIFNGKADVKDSNLALNFNGLIGINPDSQLYNFKLDIEGADLKALHLTDSNYRIKGTITTNIVQNKGHAINGTGGLTDVIIVKNNKPYPIKTFAFLSASHADNDSISIRSDFMNADFYGTIQVSQLPAVLEAHLNHYFKIPNSPIVDNYEIQKFKFNIDIGRTDLITDIFYPKIQKLVTGPIKGSYNSKTSIIKLDIEIPEIEYNGATFDSIKMKVNSDPSRLNYDIYLGQLSTGVSLKNITLHGKIESDSIGTTLTVKDDSNKTKFMVAAALRSLKDEIVLNIKPRSVIINYQPWEVSKDNYIKSGKEIYAHNLEISHNKGSITINSPQAEGAGSPLNIDFKDFNLAEVTGWLQKDTLLAGGKVNGNIELKDLEKTPVFNVKVDVNDFSYKNDSLGNVSISANNNQPDKYYINTSIKGNGNDALIKGYYSAAGNKPTFNFDALITSLSLKSIGQFAKGQLSNLSGSIDGKLLLKGEIEHPDIIGNLHFSESEFTLNYLNTGYKLHNENLVFNSKNISFNDFTISDSANNKAIVNGYIYTSYFKDYKFDLKVKTNHFLALNSQEPKGALYYGKILVTSQTNIHGNLSAPIVDVNAHLEKGTYMTVVIPKDEPSIEERKGVVFFQDIHRPPNKILFKRKKFDTTVENSIKGVELTSNIEVDKDARLKIIVDPDAGDYLDVKGAGTLSMGMRTDGTISLTGRYEILEGSYQLTFYEFVKRRFTIQQGGSITWLGSPTNAELNLTAMYETRAAPLPILQQEVNTNNLNLYRQELRFQVLLKMTGSLMKPDINMDITLNDLDKGAFNGAVLERLTEMEQDKSEINKQVFALLVLNQLINDNPFATQGTIPADIAYSSVSELVDQQLNALSSKLLKKGQLNFDVRSYDDYSTGTGIRATDFKATLQEQFLKDRLVVNLGSEINVDGTDNIHPQASTAQALSDVSIEYLLTKDGRYRVLVFRDNTYDGIIEGQLVETGAGLVYVTDFNHFNELFRKPKNGTEEQMIPPANSSSPK